MLCLIVVFYVRPSKTNFKASASGINIQSPSAGLDYLKPEKFQSPASSKQRLSRLSTVLQVRSTRTNFKACSGGTITFSPAVGLDF